MSTLKELLYKQKSFNDKIRGENYDRTEWSEIYLLGMVTEVDDFLKEISWKKHRASKNINPDRTNIALELADLTKYVMSLWELWGFTDDDILDYVALKSRCIELESNQEKSVIPSDRPIVICDIDGTLGDWRKTFLEWIESKGIHPASVDFSKSLIIDADLSMTYKDYYDLKEEFESTGQYRNIQIYEDSFDTLYRLRSDYNAYIILETARPSDKYSRIWMDTWIWIEKNHLPVDKLIMGSESRILLAHELSAKTEVILLEDDPGLIMRGANSGITVFARGHSYNRGLSGGISGGNIRIVDSYREVKTSEFFTRYHINAIQKEDK
jgi:hypothetical protein